MGELMATITSAGSGDWGTGATWVGGVAPADNDAVVIASGHSVVFNVDTSGFANGIAGLTITGTLSVSSTTTSYLKMKAATFINGAGTFNIGTSGTPIPFAVKFTLTGGSGWYVQGSGGLTMGVYGAEPTYTYAKLSGAESAGATRLEIDTDLTGDIWANADSIRINNVAQAANSELRTIGAITSTYIDITAGLTASKLIGSYVVLITRNVAITGIGVNVLQNFASGKLVIAGGSFTSDSRSMLSTCVSPIISGGAFSGNLYALNACTTPVISGGMFSGNIYGLLACTSPTISSGVFVGNTIFATTSVSLSITGGIFSGATSMLFNNPTVIITGGAFSGSTQIIYQSTATITGATFTGNGYDINQSQFTAYNQSLTSTVENYQYANFSRNTYSESIDHDGTAGAFKAWTKGGVTTSVATPVPTGFTRSYQLAPENATVEGFFNRRVNVPAGKTITLTLHLRKNASMTYLPRVWVHKLGTEPFTTAGDILHTFTMTNANDTWETDTYSYTNTADYDVELNCRFIAMNATGYVYGQVLDSLGGGGVSRARILGGM
jgi:hypothetical protein